MAYLVVRTDDRQLWEKMVSKGEGFGAWWSEDPSFMPHGECSFLLPEHVVTALQPEAAHA